MFLLGDDRRLVLSASDLRTAAGCEFALVRELDVALGRASRLEVPDDPMAARVIELGNEHEQAELRRLVAEHRGRVVQFGRPGYSRLELERAHAETLDALHSDAEVVYQATTSSARTATHHSVTVPMGLIAWEHCSTVQPSSPRATPS